MPSTRDAVRAWETLLRAQSAVFARLTAELAAAGMPVRFYDVLYNLSRAPGHRLRLRDLNHEVVLSQSGLSRLVERMEREGLVTRQPDPADARGTIVGMTPAGLAALRRVAPLHTAGIERHLRAALSDIEITRLERLCDKLLRAQRPPESG